MTSNANRGVRVAVPRYWPDGLLNEATTRGTDRSGLARSQAEPVEVVHPGTTEPTGDEIPWEDGWMLGHLGINVPDLRVAKAYYDQIMPLLGFDEFFSNDGEF